MKVDVYKREERFLSWKERVLEEGVPGISAENTNVFIQYILDMETGTNTATGSKKGGRSYPRLCNLAQRMTWILRMLEKRGVHDVRSCEEKVVVSLFADMDRGVVRTKTGERYHSVGDYAGVFKAFWHWWMKVNRKQGRVLPDITEDISTRSEKSSFVCVSKEDLEKLLPYFSEDEQVLLYFLFDSMIRAPTEVLSLQAGNIYEREGEVWVTIPDEVSKTFGRTLNLLYCGQAVVDHIRRKKLCPDDQLFSFKPWLLNRKLQQVAAQLFGEQRSHAQAEYFRKITLYDFRHSGAVHFRVLAKENPGCISLDALRHRGGWTGMKMLDYYTQFLGLDGKIDKQGILMKRDKHHLEQEMEQLRAELAEMRRVTAEILSASGKGLALLDTRKSGERI